jgi:hypothetical protein
MAMFDWYQPKETLHCPVCGRSLSEWQGSDGPSALLVWAEGNPMPIDQRIDPELRVVPWPNSRWRLPQTFSIYSYDCGCPYPVEALGTADGDCWSSTEVIDLRSAKQRKSETKAQWAARRKWLSSGDRAAETRGKSDEV